MPLTPSIRLRCWRSVGAVRSVALVLMAGIATVSMAVGQEPAPVDSGGNEVTKPELTTSEQTTSEHSISLDSLGQDNDDAGGDLAFDNYDTKLPIEKDGDDNVRFTLDISSRVIFSKQAGKVSTQHVVGIDYHKVFSDKEGGWGTLRLQPYLTRLDNVGSRPPYFEGEDDWEHVFRFFDFNYTRLAQGKFNIRVGHFEIPFGLEYPIDTNGTMHQFIPGRNLGLKADWGISINGTLPYFNYEVSLTRGTGNEIDHRGQPYAVAGRIGTPNDKNLIIGLSAFHGRVWSPASVGAWRAGLRPSTAREMARGVTSTAHGRGRDDVIRRTRFGIDIQWYRGTIGVLAEASYGRDYNQDVFNGLAELNWNNRDETWFAYTQANVFAQRFYRGGWDSEVQSIWGIRYRPNTHWSYSFQYTQQVETLFDGPDNSIIMFQTRYRF